jgi:hypothetical protein
MEKKFVIQNGQGLYWYGYYSNKNWTSDLSEAKFFDRKSDVSNFMKESDENFLVATKVWVRG